MYSGRSTSRDKFSIYVVVIPEMLWYDVCIFSGEYLILIFLCLYQAILQTNRMRFYTERRERSFFSNTDNCAKINAEKFSVSLLFCVRKKGEFYE